jgi:signal recognition particle subunit SEC65
MIDNVNVKDATNLLNDINYDYMHPVNDLKHPKHKECIYAYQLIEDWVNKSMLTQNQSKTMKKNFL